MLWSNLSPLSKGLPPGPRFKPGFTSLDGKLYVLGGLHGSDGDPGGITDRAGDKQLFVRECVCAGCSACVSAFARVPLPFQDYRSNQRCANQ